VDSLLNAYNGLGGHFVTGNLGRRTVGGGWQRINLEVGPLGITAAGRGDTKEGEHASPLPHSDEKSGGQGRRTRRAGGRIPT
jgi:hypothetical protein